MKAYITGIRSYLPSNIEETPIGRLRKKTGIERRHICAEGEVASDMALKAAKKIFEDNIAKKKEIDYLLFCTQSPDYYLPTSACVLQYRLGLGKICGAIDFNMGCSGFVYGLGLAKGLIESGQAKTVLLLTAETYSKHINIRDNATKVLFGDAATATVISGIDLDTEGLSSFVYGTDGSGAGKLIVPVGGMRYRYEETEMDELLDEYGNYRTNRDLFMDGFGIMEFALKEVPDTVEEILKTEKVSRYEIDYYVFHQANKFMLRYLQSKCGLEDCPFWNDVREYGNTVSNSIPLAMCDLTRKVSVKSLKKVMTIGFGVGLSWAGCVVDLSKM